ncbi:MAG: hypothetical protein ACR2G3_08830 [Solirubrobacterales bacterium]
MGARVYVIELTPDAGCRRDPRIPWVYVGSSARDAELRFAQHQRGYKSSGLVKRCARRLRPDLYEDLPEFRRSGEATEAEEARALELASAGFVAHSDGISHGLGAGGWEEWDAARLHPVASRVDAAAEELRGAAFEPLGARDCARLLHGERGFWLAAYIDPADPPPSYGLFSHVRLDVLAERVGGMVPSP